MEYVKELNFDGKVPYKRYAIYSLARFDGYGVVSSGQRIGAKRLCESGIVGTYYDSFAHVGYAVCQNERSAALSKFVVSTETLDGVVSSITHGEDTCMVSDWHLYGFLTGQENATKVIISTPTEAIRFIDSAGAIVEITVDSVTYYTTLYDILIKLCRAGDVNFMKYRSIRMYNERAKVTSTVTLSDTVEANRFYMKMLLEATSRR